MRTATRKVTGYYPAFDVTPPELVSAIVTPNGIYSPYNIEAALNK
jgi:methylthioribose-1-phosphate isomerase